MRKQYLILCTALLFFLSATAQPKVIDNRYCQSPVKHQQDRGTCTAFAVAACLETFPGLPADVSEQYIYAGLKMLDYDSALTEVERGGMLHYYKESLKNFGVFHEKLMPYNPSQLEFNLSDPNLVQVIRESQTGPVSMLMKKSSAKAAIFSEADVEWADIPGGRDAERIKKLLQNGVKAVAVSYLINVDEFSALTRQNNHLIVPDSSFLVKDLKKDTSYYFWDARIKYGGALETKIKNGELDTWSPFRTGGHAMTVVGYNEDGFIIKNSWGKNFGDNGYVIISYDYHRLFARRMFAVKKIHFIKPEKFVPPALQTDIRLKVIPLPESGGLSLSVFCINDKTDPLMGTVDYALYVMKNGRRTLLEKQTGWAPLTGEYNNSFEVKVLQNKLQDLDYLRGTAIYEVELSLPGSAGKPAGKRLYKNIKVQNNEYRAVGY